MMRGNVGGDARRTLPFEGFGVGYLFIPRTLTAFAGLRGAQAATGSALLGLGRQQASLAGGYMAHGYGAEQSRSPSAPLSGPRRPRRRCWPENAFFVTDSLFVFRPLVFLLKKGDGATAGGAH